MRAAAGAWVMRGILPTGASPLLVGGPHQDLVDIDVRGPGDAEQDRLGDVPGLQLAHVAGPSVEAGLGGRMADVVAQFRLDHAGLDHADADVVHMDLATERL